MTNLVDRPTSPRGQRRRDQLVDAGVELLAESGWPGVTTRSVAERANANLGLIHYYWGGLPNLKIAIARRVGAEVFDPVTLALSSTTTVEQAHARLIELLAAPHDSRTARLTVEVIAGAAREPLLGEALREALTETRAKLRAWIKRVRPSAPDGSETVLIALLDGMLLHRMLDPDLDNGEALSALSQFLPGGPPSGATGEASP
ncbi:MULTISPECIES: TetR/AcrR family transcriptional regulator [unclassified Streptomyces]|uniref:TetR/AcrR family transcriptional regulator n=1 Tax=unclassified Streptomyces TaxID=2593676 RepID=UPI00074A204C|nr:MULTISPECIES: TetR/AcrR family transcriptional regulator [unclassified Streptomyces]KUL55618.1 TetR family transcriptional regulator [Streptomyces sp. NRRL S-1521]THC46438.1 TetR/AcrR family transcriptional regulator [Streptomyces sp. A1499]